MTDRPSAAALLAEVRSAGSEIDAVLAEALGKLEPSQLRDLMLTEAAPPPTQVPASAGPGEFHLVPRLGESPADALARAGTSPFLPAAATLRDFRVKDGMGGMVESLDAVVRQLEQQATDASAGDLTRAEAVLAVQATTLDAVFNAMARKAAANIDKHADATERFLRMALKAQAQCRATLETLAAIKQGPVVFARQANINNGGQQQVNNGGGAPSPAPRTRARSKGKASRSNELLEGGHGQRMDP